MRRTMRSRTSSQAPPPRAAPTRRYPQGFVYKRVPHVTLKSIANNEEIDAIHAKWQDKLDELLKRINKAAGQKLGRVGNPPRRG